MAEVWDLYNLDREVIGEHIRGVMRCPKMHIIWLYTYG